MQQVAVQPTGTECGTLTESLPVALDHEGVPAAAFRAELPSDDDRALALAAGRPVLLGPLADAQLEAELAVHVERQRACEIERIGEWWQLPTEFLRGIRCNYHMDRRTLLQSGGLALGALVAGCLGRSTDEPTTSDSPDGFVRPESSPDPARPLECPNEEFTRHPPAYDTGAVEWGETDEFSLRVSETSFAYGDEAEFWLRNTAGRRVSIGTAEKFQIELYTTAGWQDIRGQIGDDQFVHTQMGLEVPQGDRLEWSKPLTEEGLSENREGNREQALRVCPELTAGRYRFLFWGTADPVAVAFDLRR